jgi:hypothetical protein
VRHRRFSIGKRQRQRNRRDPANIRRSCPMKLNWLLSRHQAPLALVEPLFA